MKSIKDIVKESIIKETNSSVKINNTSFFELLINGKSKPLINFSLLFVTVVIVIVFLITSFAFFIKDILFFENTIKMNSQGTIVSERSCNRESFLFLFNSSDQWANTGIQISKGDKIKMTVSGSFNSDVFGLKNLAENNSVLKYEWVSPNKQYKSQDSINPLVYWFSPNKQYKSQDSINPLVYNDDDSYFGSVLYKVETIKQHSPCDNDYVEINENGTLCFSVNEIDLSKKDVLEKEVEDDSINGEKLRENLNAYYEDNIGQILVSISIDRKAKDVDWKSSWYRSTEREVFDVWDEHPDRRFLNIISTLIVFIISVGDLIWKILAVLVSLHYIVLPVLIALLVWLFGDKIVEYLDRKGLFLYCKKQKDKIKKLIRRKCKR